MNITTYCFMETCLFNILIIFPFPPKKLLPHLAHDGAGGVPGHTADHNRVVAGAGHVHPHPRHLETLGTRPVLGTIPGDTSSWSLGLTCDAHL